MNVTINGKSSWQTAKWLTYDEIARLSAVTHPKVMIHQPGVDDAEMRPEESVTLADGMTITATSN